MVQNTLPPDILDLLQRLQASPKLIAHLAIVHAAALVITGELATYWPTLHYDKQAVLFGAATHDIGKIAHPQELTQPGKQHEESGPALLMQQGISVHYTRFARTHGRWQAEVPAQLEDLLVAFADKTWKGQRDEALEQAIVQHIAEQTHEEPWNVYMKLDDIAEKALRM